MLILTRKYGETIIIGDKIKVTILNVKGGGVRVGIEAPKDVPVHREEVYQRIQEKLATHYGDNPTNDETADA